MAKVCVICNDNFKPKYSSLEKTCQDKTCQKVYRELQYSKPKELKKYSIPKKSEKRKLE